MTDFAAARKNMVDCQIQTNGVTNLAIIDAFTNVPRETFLPINLQNVAYADEDLHIGKGRYLSEPIPHGRMIQAVEPTKDDVVLDIGGATGYPAAIMSQIAKGVVAVEEDALCLDHAAHAWNALGLTNIAPVKGKLGNGCTEFAPYNIIFINGAVAEIPHNLLTQLAPGGRLIAIVKKPGAVMGKVTLVKNSVGDKFSSRELFEAGGHYIPGFEPREEFIFRKG